jgi:hypothetical protein
MFKAGSRGDLVAVFVTPVLAGLGLTGCDGKPDGTYNHGGGVVDGWPVWGHGDSNGKQYVVLSAGGHSALQNKQGDYVIAYALP